MPLPAASGLPALSNALTRAPGLAGTVWALQAKLPSDAPSILTAAAVTSALATTGVAGYSVRLAWSDLWSNGGPADNQGLMASAASMLNPGQKLMIRFVAGTQTPPDVLAACDNHVPASPCGNGVTSAGGAGVTYTATTLVDTANPFTASQANNTIIAGNSYAVCTASTNGPPGTLTVAQWLGAGTPANGTAYTTGAAPTPFHNGNVSGITDGSPNTQFEAFYQRQLDFMLAQMKALGVGSVIVMARAPQYGDQFAELNHGATLRGLTGYSYANWLTGHKRLFDLARLTFAPAGVPYEHPLTGCGPIHGGATPASQDLATYYAQQDPSGLCWVQGNGAGIQNYASAPGNADPQASNAGFGLAGATVISSEVALKAAIRTAGLRRAAQMIQVGDHSDWPQIFTNLIGYGCQILEVYTGASFTGTHSADLVAQIARFRGAWTSPAATTTMQPVV